MRKIEATHKHTNKDITYHLVNNILPNIKEYKLAKKNLLAPKRNHFFYSKNPCYFNHSSDRIFFYIQLYFDNHEGDKGNILLCMEINKDKKNDEYKWSYELLVPEKKLVGDYVFSLKKLMTAIIGDIKLRDIILKASLIKTRASSLGKLI